LRLILISCRNSKIPFVMSIFDGPITPKKKKKKTWSRFEQSHNRYVAISSFGLPIGYKRRTWKQKIWTKNLYFATCKKLFWLDMQHMATIVLTSWNQTFSPIPQKSPPKKPHHPLPKTTLPNEKKKKKIQNIIFKFN